MFLSDLSFFALLALAGWVYLATFHGRFWRPLVDDTPCTDPPLWPSVTIVVPAHDEADILPQSLPTLLKQDYPGPWRVILVDDHSEDGTGAEALRIAESLGASHRLTVLFAPELPPGWTGKVAAMQHGYAEADSDYVMFTDADIAHPADSLRRLAARAEAENLDLVSWMVRLRCESLAERFLVPAFVFFFAMLYPFRKAADPRSGVAAAAGGVMLARRKALKNIGGLAAIRSALIDDCSLARAIKDHGGDNATEGHIRLTLVDDALSLRPYQDLGDVWRMVARTAFTQLNYSPVLLLGTVLGMGLLFLLPLIAALFGDFFASTPGFFTYLGMSALYWPTIKFYRLPWWWACTLPFAALIYIGATVDSARLYWSGKGGQWKGRSQALS